MGHRARVEGAPAQGDAQEGMEPEVDGERARRGGRYASCSERLRKAYRAVSLREDYRNFVRLLT